MKLKDTMIAWNPVCTCKPVEPWVRCGTRVPTARRHIPPAELEHRAFTGPCYQP